MQDDRLDRILPFYEYAFAHAVNQCLALPSNRRNKVTMAQIRRVHDDLFNDMAEAANGDVKRYTLSKFKRSLDTNFNALFGQGIFGVDANGNNVNISDAVGVKELSSDFSTMYDNNIVPVSIFDKNVVSVGNTALSEHRPQDGTVIFARASSETASIKDIVSNPNLFTDFNPAQFEQNVNRRLRSESPGTRRMRHEYSFMNMILEYNKKFEGNEGIIPLTQAFEINDEIKTLASVMAAGAGSNYSADMDGFECESRYFIAACDVILSKRFKDYSRADMLKVYSDSLKSFDESLVPSNGSGPRLMPFSPCDSRFRDKEFVINSGAQIQYMTTANLQAICGKDLDYSRLSEFDAGYNNHISFVERDKNGNVRPMSRNSVAFTSIHDILGVTPLIRHMTTEERNDIIGRGYQPMGNHITKAHIGDDRAKRDTMLVRRGNQVYIRDAAARERLKKYRDTVFENSSSVLDTLSELGYSYTIATDSNASHPYGQLQVMVDNTNVAIRLLDTEDQLMYIGRSHIGGSVSASVYFTKPNKGYEGRVPGPHQVSDLVRYAFGYPVKRPVVDKSGNVLGNSDIDVGEYDEYADGSTRKASVYHGDKGTTALYASAWYVSGDSNAGKQHTSPMSIIVKKDDNAYRDPIPNTGDPVESEAFLIERVAMARDAYRDAINIDMLFDTYESWRIRRDSWENGVIMDEEPPEVPPTPEFSGNRAVATVQEKYWDYIVGNEKYLFPPELDERDNSIGAPDAEVDSEDDESVLSQRDVSAFNHPYESASKRENVEQHLADLIDYKVGNITMDSNGFKHWGFNPITVSQWAFMSDGEFRGRRRLSSAIRALNINPDELKGDDQGVKRFKDTLIQFGQGDNNNIRCMKDAAASSPFMRSMYDTICETLRTSGFTFDENNILIDDNGVVQYTVTYATRQGLKGDAEDKATRTGYIGQIFDLNPDGSFTSKFAGSDNKVYLPGYQATVLPKTDKVTGGFYDRIRLRGYEQEMVRAIRSALRQDLMVVSKDMDFGSETNLNRVYSGLYTERYNIGEQQVIVERGMDASLQAAREQSAMSRVKFDKTFGENATVFAHNAHSSKTVEQAMNDLNRDPFTLTGFHNIAILAEDDGAAIFDANQTQAGQGQGSQAYLVTGASVDVDGSIIPSEKENDEGFLSAWLTEHGAKCEFDPPDRRQMALSNLSTAVSYVPEVNIAFMTCGGWNMDDGFVISKKFADTHTALDHNGNPRNLVVGDKISDMHGNKGVVGVVIDPDMTDEEAEANGILDLVRIFRANPDLDVTASPYSSVSRYNAGTTRELMSHERKDLVMPDGTVIEGALGTMSMCVTKHSADVKTHIYDDVDYNTGKGRKMSAQASWALNCKGANAIMSEVYKTNSSVLANMREFAILWGCDIEEDGSLRVGYQPHEGEHRRVFTLPDLDTFDRGGKGFEQTITAFQARELFDAMMSGDSNIGQSGGIMELPFPLDFAYFDKDEDGNEIHSQLPNLNRSKTGITDPDSPDASESYGLPVLSYYLRTNQEFMDGSISTHDYTRHYFDIFYSALKYKDADAKLKLLKDVGQSLLDGPNGKNYDKDYFNEQCRKLEQAKADCKAAAQLSYNRITDRTIDRQLVHKNNIVRDGIMAKRLSCSATSIITPDPRLSMDTIGMSAEMADSLGIEDGDSVLVWRDPVLRDAGMRYVKVQIDKNLAGISLPPQCAKSYDGDFDGDTMGVFVPKSREAKFEAALKFGVGANLLNKGVEPDANGDYDLLFTDGLDIKTAMYHHPELKDVYDNIKRDVNAFERDLDAKIKALDGDYNAVKNADGSDSKFACVTDGSSKPLSPEAKRQAVIELEKSAMTQRSQFVNRLNMFYKDCFSQSFGKAVLSYKDIPTHLKSVKEACIDSGAKGNMEKFGMYTDYFGAECQKDANGVIDINGPIKDLGRPGITLQDKRAVQLATAIKSFGTGMAGKYSQRGMMALRNVCPEAVCELTYPVTQAILQIKHDPHAAQRIYKQLLGPVRQLWQGYAMDYDPVTKNWSVRYNAGEPMPSTVEEWKNNFITLYTDKEKGMGVDINPAYIDVVLRYISDGRYVDNIESPDFKYSSTMDKIAYDTNNAFDKYCRMSDAGKNIYCEYGDDFVRDGQGRVLVDNISSKPVIQRNVVMTGANAQFAPDKIRKNLRTLENYRQTGDSKFTKLEGFSKSDVKVSLAELNSSIKTDTFFDDIDGSILYKLATKSEGLEPWECDAIVSVMEEAAGCVDRDVSRKKNVYLAVQDAVHATFNNDKYAGVGTVSDLQKVVANSASSRGGRIAQSEADKAQFEAETKLYFDKLHFVTKALAGKSKDNVSEQSASTRIDKLIYTEACYKAVSGELLTQECAKERLRYIETAKQCGIAASKTPGAQSVVEAARVACKISPDTRPIDKFLGKAVGKTGNMNDLLSTYKFDHLEESRAENSTTLSSEQPVKTESVVRESVDSGHSSASSASKEDNKESSVSGQTVETSAASKSDTSNKSNTAHDYSTLYSGAGNDGVDDDSKSVENEGSGFSE